MPWSHIVLIGTFLAAVPVTQTSAQKNPARQIESGALSDISDLYANGGGIGFAVFTLWNALHLRR